MTAVFNLDGRFLGKYNDVEVQSTYNSSTNSLISIQYHYPQDRNTKENLKHPRL